VEAAEADLNRSISLAVRLGSRRQRGERRGMNRHLSPKHKRA
jgi:hypothetical protein